MQDTDKDVYEWNAKAYDQFSDMQYDLALELLNQLSLRGDETIIDAGCGSGRVTVKILERLPSGKLIGVDLSQNMLDMAREQVIPKEGQQVDFIKANLQDFALPQAADGIFSSMAMHFVPDHARLMKNMAATLRPGGWLAVQFAGNPLQAGMLAPLRDLLTLEPYAPYFQQQFPPMHEADVEESKRDLREAGFVDVKVAEISVRLTEHQRQSMLQFFKTAFLERGLELLPVPFRPEFVKRLDAIMEHLFEEPFNYVRCEARLPQIN